MSLPNSSSAPEARAAVAEHRIEAAAIEVPAVAVRVEEEIRGLRHVGTPYG